MIALKLPEVKECMSKLLLSDTFDSFIRRLGPDVRQ